MERELSKSVPIEFDGLDATEHRLDASQLGRSLQGIAKLYRSVNHFYFTGAIPSRMRAPDVRILVGPPREGSVTYALWVLIAHGRLPMYPEMLAEFVDVCTPQVVKAVIAKRAGQPRVAEKAMEIVHDLAKENAEITKRFIEYGKTVELGHQERDRAERDEKARMMALIERLAQVNGSAMTNMVSPVGYSARSLTHSKDEHAEYVIDEPAADAIRAKGSLEVLDETTVKVRIEGVDKIARTCKILSDDWAVPVKGKITDPVLDTPENVYTKALDTTRDVVITGKPVLRDGELYMFYISNARDVGDGA